MIYEGNVLDILPTLEKETVQSVVTSPPYWGLRDYDNDGQLGQEELPEEFIEKLVNIFSLVGDVLKQDGTLWINLGDTYYGPKGGHYDKNSITNDDTGTKYREKRKAPPKHDYIKTGDLVGVPWKFAIEMQKKGWYLRNDIIWHKPNPMPEAVNNRLCKSHEHIFLFTKIKSGYYFNADAIRKNDVRKTDVWSMNTSSFAGAHFAVFPKELPAICILAGTKEGDVVLDPFMGSGTTAYVAQELSRKWIGVELNPDYIKIIKERTQQQTLF
tara:strand:+ start:6125 stop:6934 length:810 start_codon:yes stop_codon:yes gene_type:complete